MTQKLFYVEVTKYGWVLAENDEEAKSFADKILDGEFVMDIDVFPYTEEYLKVSGYSGWNKDCLVYHKDQRNKDIKLGDVLND